ncbi:N-6 DNA methylase [Paraburkholderia sediminicola]|uniref:N-6 DNA methylase n=1 Tax=Paraburkholderia sediminicola TaxID=458836 RepID=UPI0038BAAA6C
MSRRQRVERAAMGGDPYKTELIKSMREFSHSHDPYTVFSDFVEMCALALSNRFDHPQFDAREKRYLDIVGKYKAEEVQRFAAMFAALQMCYRTRVDAIGDPGCPGIPGDGLGDVLGEIFMALELGNDRAGQFFTPYSVSLLMAMMIVGDAASVREKGFVTLQEPACGSAGMVVATAQAMHQVGLNYPETLHATCVDIDQRCVHMAFVQLSLLGIPAIVVHGNGLSLEVWGVWYTPAHVMLGWGRKLRRRREAEAKSIIAGYTEPPGSCNEPGTTAPDGHAPGLAVPEVASTADGQHHAVEQEEGDVAVAVDADRAEMQFDAQTSIAALFEELTGQATAVKVENTIFDRIEQMTLF